MTSLATIKQDVHNEVRWYRGPDSRRAGAALALDRVRRGLGAAETDVNDLSALQSDLRRLGDVADVPLLRGLLERRSDLNEQLVDMAGESIRFLREKADSPEEIERLECEERMLLRLLTPFLRKPDDSRWVAVRRGKIVVEAADRSSVMGEIYRRRRTTNHHYHAIVLPVDELNDLRLEGIIAAEDAELWEAVRNRSLSPTARLRALDELIARGDAGVPAFAVAELEREQHGVLGDWRDGLLVSTERVVVLDPELRSRLTRILLTHAQALRGGGATPALWAALRRYATLVPADESGSLLEFLDDAAPGLTHQVVFQCIANVFSVEPPADGTALDALRARVASLAGAYLSVRPLETGEQMSLATNAFAAAAALGSEDLERFEGLVLAQRERWLVDAAISRLRAFAEAWKEPAGGDETRAFHVVAESLGRLSATPYRST